ncbi:hypothetical protein Pla110_31840 [Polystyrenella longa]|uniref:Glycosyl hydrolase family 32 N-terminal domain-containing protein n=1 Tax=Polystyrenella longa TaxID=2528007 RepID=A0A518CQF3_9PLAN|nr:hypothetical protein [Polystyrenella longa]QDU81443.1 hypothetical protein Pla110_31840 [Polystyrenella longa]
MVNLKQNRFTHAVRMLGGISVVVALLSSVSIQAQDSVLDIGDKRELFVDDYLIDTLDGTEQQLSKLRDEGPVIQFDNPWEGAFCGYVTIIKDGDEYRCYYRALPQAGKDGNIAEAYAMATSKDGIHWEKPKLGLFEFDGSKENNIVFGKHAPETHNFCPMLDGNPNAAADARYKALGGTKSGGGLVAFKSPDGINWTEIQEEPVITQGAFDSQNVPMWSASEQKYICYLRVFVDGIRRISRCESDDFVNWTEPKLMGYKDKPAEHLYTNQTRPYFRAPHIYVSTAARFFPGRQVLDKEQAEEVGVHPSYFKDISDGIFMTTRGGTDYDRTFMEGFIRPGIGYENWVSRTNYPALGCVPTGENEMSVYANMNYGQPTAYLRRFSMRLDGFASIHADYDGGTATTKPFIFDGKELTVNFATSAAGEIFTEIQDADGTPIPGFTMDDSVRSIGNEISRTIRWKSGADVSSLAGKPVRLHFKMKDADLYSIKFEK